MKRSVLCLLLALPLLISSCRKLTDFRIKDSSQFTIPMTAPVNLPFFDTMSVSTSSAYEFENNGTDTKHIKSIKLDQLTLTITNPPSQTFNFLSSIHLYIIAEGLPEVEIAYRDNIDATSTSVDLVTTGADLTEYIKKDNYSLRVKTTTKGALTQDVTIRSDMTFLVRAKLI